MQHPAAALPVARAFQPEFCPAKAACEARFFKPQRAPEATEVAVDLHTSRGWACQRAAAACFRGACPLTPDPSPPFGGEGSILCVCAV